MKKGLFRRGCLLLGTAWAVGAMVPTVAAADPSCAGHGEPAVSQPFSSFGDTHDYVMLSGADPDGFDATGWQLYAGAHVSDAIVADGTVNPVLDLPSFSVAVSPTICVDTTYPDLRTMVANVSGAQGVFVAVEYFKGGQWRFPLAMGTARSSASEGFAPSRELQIHSAAFAGSVPARFVFVGAGTFGASHQDYHLYRVAVDPRMAH